MSTTFVASGLLLDSAVILRTSLFFIGSVAIVIGAKWLRDRVAARRGFKLTSLIVDKDNTPVAIEMGGFLLAMVIGLLGSLQIQGYAWWEQARDLVGTGSIVLLVLLFNDQVITRLVLRGIDCNRAVTFDHNLAVAIVRAAGNVATAFTLTAALGHDSALWERLIWVVLAQGALVLLSLGYQKLTPYDDVDEVRNNNVAAALPMAGILLAVGIVVQAAVSGDGRGWVVDLITVGLDLIVSAILILVLRFVGDRLLLPGSTLHDEIARDKNAGVGFIEAMLYLSGAWGAAYFLN